MASKGDRSRSLDSTRTRHSVPAMQALPAPTTQSSLDSSSDNSFMDTNVPKYTFPQAIADVPPVPKPSGPGTAVVRFAGRPGVPPPNQSGAGDTLQPNFGTMVRTKPPPPQVLRGSARSGSSRGGTRLQGVVEQSPDAVVPSLSGQSADERIVEMSAEVQQARTQAREFETELRRAFEESQMQFHQETVQLTRNAEQLADQRVGLAQDEALSACMSAQQTHMAAQ